MRAEAESQARRLEVWEEEEVERAGEYQTLGDLDTTTLTSLVLQYSSNTSAVHLRLSPPSDPATSFMWFSVMVKLRETATNCPMVCRPLVWLAAMCGSMFLVTVYWAEVWLVSAVSLLMYQVRRAGGWDSGRRQSASSRSPRKYLELRPNILGPE